MFPIHDRSIVPASRSTFGGNWSEILNAQPKHMPALGAFNFKFNSPKYHKVVGATLLHLLNQKPMNMVGYPGVWQLAIRNHRVGVGESGQSRDPKLKSFMNA